MIKELKFVAGKIYTKHKKAIDIMLSLAGAVGFVMCIYSLYIMLWLCEIGC